MLSPKWITIKNAQGNNLKNIDVEIPLGLFVCVTGVSGSGKSTLIQDTLFPRLMYEVYGTRTVWEPHDGVTGLDPLRQSDRHRPISDWSDATLKSRNLHRHV